MTDRFANKIGITPYSLPTIGSHLIDSNGPALLRAVALESLFVAVDPVGKRLIPVDGIVG